MRQYFYNPDYGVVPGETIKELLEHKGLTQGRLAVALGTTKGHVSQLISGKLQLLPRHALVIEELLGVSAEYWLTLELHYRLWLARKTYSRKKGKTHVR